MSADLVEIVHSLREQLCGRGMGGMRGLGVCFSVNDLDRSGYFDFQEFEQVLAKAGLFLKRQELSKLYRHFDRDHNERVYYPDVLRAIQGDLTSYKLQLIHAAFNKLEVAHDDANDDAHHGHHRGLVHIDTILNTFDPSRHPQVLSGQKKPSVLKQEFVLAMQGAGANNNGLVTKNEFIDYFAAIFASIPDEYVCVLMERGFGIATRKGSSSSSSSSSSLPFSSSSSSSSSASTSDSSFSALFGVLREKIRQKTGSTSRESESLRNTFKHFDLDNSGLLEFNKFLLALERFGIVLERSVARQLFNAFLDKTCGNGEKMNYCEFTASLYEDASTTLAYTQRSRERGAVSALSKSTHNGRTYMESDHVLVSTSPLISNNPIINIPKSESLSVPTLIFVLGGPCVGVPQLCQDLQRDGFIHIRLDSTTASNNKNNNPVEVLENEIRRGVSGGNFYFLASGFPSTLSELDGFSAALKSSLLHVPFALFLDAPNQVLEQRCQRSGISKELIAQQINQYVNDTIPVVDAFQREGKLRIINAVNTQDQVLQQVKVQLAQI